jgi:hypothetical protein
MQSSLIKRVLGPILLILLLIGVGAGIYFSAREQLTARRVVSVRGLIGSEKEDFFKDPRVIDALRQHGIETRIEKAGSRQIATGYDLTEYDFVFPAGVPAAEKIRIEQGITRQFNPFFTPMAIASWKPIAEILTENGLAEDHGGYYTLNMERYLELVDQGMRWSDLKANSAYDVNKSVLIASTDVRKSNSAAMYLGLASFVANGNEAVKNEEEVEQAIPLLEALFLKQGYVAYSSEVPFQDYLVMGMGKAPLVMIYEAQFLYQAATAEAGLLPDMVLMYPEPTIFSKHILIPLSEAGERLGELLSEDPTLKHLAIEHGFRNDDIARFREFAETHDISMPDTLVDVIEPPSYEILEHMIVLIEQKYQ